MRQSESQRVRESERQSERQSERPRSALTMLRTSVFFGGVFLLRPSVGAERRGLQRVIKVIEGYIEL